MQEKGVRFPRQVWLLPLVALALAGCAPLATEDSLLRLEGDLKRVQLDLERFKRNPVPGLAQEVSVLSKDVKELKEEMATLKREVRRGQADLVASLDGIKQEVQNWTGKSEKAEFEARKAAQGATSLKEDLSPKVYFLDGLVKGQQERLKVLDQTTARVQALLGELESSLAKWKEENQKKLAKLEEDLTKLQATPGMAPAEPPKEPPKEETKAPPPTPLEAGYQEAFDLFSAGNYKGAKEKFKEFLKRYPGSPLARDAHFWVAESSFRLKGYEEAILEYEEFLTRYPEGDRAPVAMLKQGLAFLELGDKIDARLLFNRVITRYPNSEQAKTASAKLKELQ